MSCVKNWESDLCVGKSFYTANEHNCFVTVKSRGKRCADYDDDEDDVDDDDDDDVEDDDAEDCDERDDEARL